MKLCHFCSLCFCLIAMLAVNIEQATAGGGTEKGLSIDYTTQTINGRDVINVKFLGKNISNIGAVVAKWDFTTGTLDNVTVTMPSTVSQLGCSAQLGNIQNSPLGQGKSRIAVALSNCSGVATGKLPTELFTLTFIKTVPQPAGTKSINIARPSVSLATPISPTPAEIPTPNILDGIGSNGFSWN